MRTALFFFALCLTAYPGALLAMDHDDYPTDLDLRVAYCKGVIEYQTKYMGANYGRSVRYDKFWLHLEDYVKARGYGPRTGQDKDLLRLSPAETRGILDAKSLIDNIPCLDHCPPARTLHDPDFQQCADKCTTEAGLTDALDKVSHCSTLEKELPF